MKQITLFTMLLLPVLFGCSQQGKPGFTIVNPGMQKVDFTIPSWAQMQAVTVERVGDEIVTTITMKGSLPAESADRLALEVYYLVPGTRVPSRALAFGFGQYGYPLKPALSPGQAGIADVETGNLVAGATVTISGAQILCRAPANSVPTGGFGYAACNYLPASISESQLFGTMQGVCTELIGGPEDNDPEPGHTVLTRINLGSDVAITRHAAAHAASADPQGLRSLAA